MKFALATINEDGRPTAVIEVDEACYRLDQVAPELLRSPERGLMNLFDDWPSSEKALCELAGRIKDFAPADIGRALSIGDFMTPLQYPAKLILGGANYYEHMFKDANKPDFRKEDGAPIFFLKPPTTSLVGCGKTVRFPVQSSKLDWEIELAVIIGKRLQRASEAEAMEGVAGYAVGIDLSARDWQMNPRHPWKFDLFTGKAFDDSCPLGPKIVPARFVDPGDLRLCLSVNGQVRQDARSSDMIWSVAEQVSILSEHVTLEPGDILLTGTPAGVGMASGSYLSPGDTITAEIDGLGVLQVEIIPAARTDRTPSPGRLPAALLKRRAGQARPGDIKPANETAREEDMTIGRRSLLKVAGAGALGAVASPAIAQSAPALKWRLQTSYPKSLGTLYGACTYFSKTVQEATDGRFEIQVFSPGDIVPALQVADAVSNNTIEMGHTAGSFNIGKDPAFGIATGLPWGLNSRQQAAWMYHAGGMDLLNEFFAGFNLYALPAGNTGAQPAGWFRKPLKSLADMKGLKMRVAGLGGVVVSKLGIVVQQLGAGDIYPALERSALDAADFVGPYDDEKLGLSKIAPYYHYPSPWEGSGEINFFFNKAKWEELPKAYKSLLTSVATAAAHDMQAKYDALNPPALVRLVAAGTIPTQTPQDIIKASYVATQETMKELSASSANFKKIYEHQLAFHKDSQRWVGMSDLPYDYHVTSGMAQK